MPPEAPESIEQPFQVIVALDPLEPVETFQPVQSIESTWSESEGSLGQRELEIKLEFSFAIAMEEIPVTPLEVTAA